MEKKRRKEPKLKKYIYHQLRLKGKTENKKS